MDVVCWGVFRNGKLIYASVFECTARSIARSVENVRGGFCEVKRTMLPENHEWIASGVQLRNMSKSINEEN